MRKALYLMGILNDADLEWIAANGRRRNVAAREILIREGEPVDALFILLDGSLEVSTRGRHVATLLAGEVVGEITFVDSRPPLATVTGGQTSRVLAIPRSALNDKIAADPWFASRFFRSLAFFLAARLRSTTARLGYGEAGQEQSDGDEIDMDILDSISLATIRFDKLLKRVQEDAPARA